MTRRPSEPGKMVQLDSVRAILDLAQHMLQERIAKGGSPLPIGKVFDAIHDTIDENIEVAATVDAMPFHLFQVMLSEIERHLEDDENPRTPSEVLDLIRGSYQAWRESAIKAPRADG